MWGQHCLRLAGRARQRARSGVERARAGWQAIYRGHRLLANILFVAVGFIGFAIALVVFALASLENRSSGADTSSSPDRFARVLLDAPAAEETDAAVDATGRVRAGTSARHAGAQGKADRGVGRDSGKRMAQKTDRPTNNEIAAAKLKRLFDTDSVFALHQPPDYPPLLLVPQPFRAATVDDALARLGLSRRTPAPAASARPASQGAAGAASPEAESPVVMGSLDKSVIYRVIQRNTSQLRPCYERFKAMLSDPVRLHFTIGPTGQVSQAQARSPTAHIPEFESCLAARMRGWSFPQPKGGGIVVVNYYLDFRCRCAATIARRDDAPTGDEVMIAADEFIARRLTIDGVPVQEASGYWANSYVPGDSELRSLELQLAAWDREPLRRRLHRPLALHDAAATRLEPFDAPLHSALAVYLRADRGHVDGPSRMLVQVGLKGTPRHSGLRSSSRVGVVLDLRRPLNSDQEASVRALLEALVAARQTGDRFVLFAAGPGGRRVIGAEQFRYGPIAVALQQLFGDSASAAPELPLAAALRQAAAEIAIGEDLDVPLGSNALLVVTAAPLGDQLEPLLAAAEQSALGGAPVSAIAIGGSALLDEIDRLVLAGQGRRRLLGNPADAAQLVDRELTAASRAVARAIRLRIRLAPGVKLIDVVGSRRLDQVAAQQVRLAEQSVDLRLARSLGIEADRGADEEGIQIVIPAFYADDAHAIVLDLVAAEAGPIADVSVRYKDLVFLRNGNGRASLSLPRTPTAVSALDRNVTANYLALLTAGSLREAGVALAAGDIHRAIDLIRDSRALLAGLQRRLPEFAHDRSLISDSAMLDDYLALLRLKDTDPTQHQWIAASLRLAGWLTLLPRADLGDDRIRTL
ncbi:MAG: AgmX/PglI C-terminal domain-containing protein [Deltaproteobacteria bacterium]|nr:AgmX/PglI C-terminal domain-containing protein [Deltaproteobacteria bacterium]